MIVREVSNELTDPSVDSQIIDLKGAGPDSLAWISTEADSLNDYNGLSNARTRI